MGYTTSHLTKGSAWGTLYTPPAEYVTVLCIIVYSVLACYLALCHCYYATVIRSHDRKDAINYYTTTNPGDLSVVCRKCNDI